jgi:hypothetical protein
LLVATWRLDHKAIYHQHLGRLVLRPPAATKFENESERPVGDGNRSSDASEPQVTAWKEFPMNPADGEVVGADIAARN